MPVLPQDPFNMKIEKVPGGTRDKPQLVPSMYSERLVGCICKLYFISSKNFVAYRSIIQSLKLSYYKGSLNICI